MFKTTDNKAFAAKPVRPTPTPTITPTPAPGGVVTNVQVYWNTFMPNSDNPQTIFDISCPTGMVALSGGGKYTWDRLNTYPFGSSITPDINLSGVSTSPASGWRFELPSEPTSPLTGFVVCAEIK